jgi:hypothetical protein
VARRLLNAVCQGRGAPRTSGTSGPSESTRTSELHAQHITPRVPNLHLAGVKVWSIPQHGLRSTAAHALPGREPSFIAFIAAACPGPPWLPSHSYWSSGAGRLSGGGMPKKDFPLLTWARGRYPHALYMLLSRPLVRPLPLPLRLGGPNGTAPSMRSPGGFTNLHFCDT